MGKNKLERLFLARFLGKSIFMGNFKSLLGAPLGRGYCFEDIFSLSLTAVSNKLECLSQRIINE
jgi:hypothetical protein